MDQDNATTAAAAPTLVVGLRFQPSDALLMGYLYCKVSGKMHMGDVIKECDLYGQKEPWELWELYGGDKLQPGEDLYFYTQLKKTLDGSRINRSVGTGTWMGEDFNEPITFSQKLLGYKQRYTYEDGVTEQVGRWIMQEYNLNASLHDNDYDYVLCRIRKNDRSN
ncbi:NAC domain - like 10 [Theobroma cacao]|nr:NAC domain - like 10 [Theobroma cacao]